MDEEKLRELETAAQILMNPQMVSNDVRMVSENMIMTFRKTKAPYAMCQHILNTTKNDYLQFEAAGLLKSAVITEFDALGDEESLGLRQYLINFVMGREDTQQYVRERVLQVVAIITKRRAIKIEIMELLNALAELEAIFQNGDEKQQYLACRVVDTLMQEFQITIKSDDSGLTFEDHFKAKKLFEATALMKIFVTITTPIRRLLACFDASNPTIAVLFGEYMRLMETILSWGFTSPLLPKRLIGLFESACKFEQSPPLRLGIKWEGVILDPEIIKLFFDVYWKVRDLKDVQRRGATCLVQLSTVYGSIMNKKENKLKFFALYFENYLQLISTVDVRAEEALPLSQIARTLMNYNHYPGMTVITDMLSKVLQPMFAMTCKFAEGAVQEELAQSEETVYMESFTNMLEAWLTILHDIPRTVLHPYLTEIFNKFLQCHLSPPDGIYAITSLDSDEITETELKDRDKFKEQLTIVGAFGREFPGHSLPLLAKLLEDKIRRLRGQLLRIHSNGGGGSGAAPDGDTKILDALYEDLHWLLLITGHVLCKDYEGEEPLMSSEILTYCIEKSDEGATDMNTSLTLLASPTQCISDIPNAEHSTDHVIRLISAVFRLCEIEKNAIAANMSSYMSPEVSSTIMWFLKFWAEGYLLPPVNYYNKIPDALRESFGKETAGGAWTVNFLLNKIYINVQSFTGEEQIVDDSIRLLVSMVKREHKCSIVVNAENFKQILSLKDVNLPMRVKCGLLEGLVLASSHTSDPKKYLDELIHPVCASYRAVSEMLNVAGNGNSPIVAEKLIVTLNEVKACLQGVADASAKHVYETFEPMLLGLADLLNYLSNSQQVVEAILDLLCKLVTITYFLSREASQKVYRVCMNCIQIYAKKNHTRVSLEATGEEDRLQDLMLLLKLMNHLLSKNFLDFGGDSPTSSEQQMHIDTAEVVVYGLESILPLITPDLLLYPNFCLQYYQTITFFLETKAHKVCSLQPEFLQKILNSVQIGLTNFSAEIQSLCLDFLQVMANTVYLDQNPNSYMYSALCPFLKHVLEMVLGQQVGSENNVECGKALFALMCVYKEQYVNAVQSLIQMQKSQSDADRLQKEFTDLTQIELINNRMTQFKFSEKFDRFLSNIGFLFTI